jgi:hypothetical protein
LYNLFTERFRVRLRLLARDARGGEARKLAAKVSPLFSVFLAIFALGYFPSYGYGTLLLLFLGVVSAGAVLAYCMPSPFILALRGLAADPSQVVLWRKDGKAEGRDES